MHRKRSILFLFLIFTVSLSSLVFVSCSKNSLEGMIIFTEVPGNMENMNFENGENWRYIPRSRLAAINPDKPGEPVKVISNDFYSACSPVVSWDGLHMLFAAQAKNNEPWAIYEMNLKSLKTRLVSHTKENCTDPAYLPGGRLVFSKAAGKDTVGAGYELYTSSLDGSELKQITFHPHANFASTLLADGRVLAISRQIYPSTGQAMLYVIRPDGTKGDLFYYGKEGSILKSKAWENSDGLIFFTESNSENSSGGSITCINQNRPLHSKLNLTVGISGDFLTAFPLSGSKLLVIYRPSQNEKYGLYEFDSHSRTLGKLVYGDKEYTLADVVIAKAYNRPKKLPSEVDMGVKTGLFLCQDVNVLEPKFMQSSAVQKKIFRIEVLGLHKSLGKVKVEADGSFYLKAMADAPVRIQALDENGKVIYGPCAWIWLRPNERRGCVGCHEDHELAPDNKVPLAVKKEPVIIPVHVKSINEKEVELE